MRNLSFNTLKGKVFSFWVVQTAGWLAYWLIFLYSLSTHYEISDPKLILWTFLVPLCGFLVSLLLWIVYHRIPYKSVSLLKLAFLILLCSFLAANIWYGIDKLLDMIMKDERYKVLPVNLRQYSIEVSTWSVLLIGWSCLYFIMKVWREWEMQKEIAEKASAEANAAQLQMMRYKLNPQFLFNSLSTVRSLIDEDTHGSREMISELSEFLRYSLLSSNYSRVPLKQELEAVRHYFALEKKRFADKLEVRYNIESKTENYPVLSFLLYPLAENALIYGMKTSHMPLKIIITSKIENDKLILLVGNTGTWIPPDKPETPGSDNGNRSLDNLRMRLENNFPGEENISWSQQDGWVNVKVIIGFRPAEISHKVKMENTGT